jgi:hypothetical protein
LCQNGSLSFSLQWVKKRIEGWVVDGCHVGFGKEFPGEKRKCETVRCDAAASSFVAKVRGEFFAHFHAVAVKSRSSMRNWLFILSGRIFL